MGEEKNMQTMEEKIVELSSRTAITVNLLRQLSDEKLSNYYNRTSEMGSRGLAACCTAVAGAAGVTAMVAFFNGDISSGIFFVGSSALTIVLAKVQFNGAAKNEGIGQEIQSALVSMASWGTPPHGSMGL